MLNSIEDLQPIPSKTGARQVGSNTLLLVQCRSSVEDLAAKAVVSKICEVVGGGPTYVTFDPDGLDPAYAPGTVMPEPGGLSSQTSLRMLCGFQGLDVIGADVNEIAPPFYSAGYTTILVNHLMFEILCLIALTRAGK